MSFYVCECNIDMNIDNKYIEQFMVEGREYQKPYGPGYNRTEHKKRESFDTLLKWAVERRRGKVRYAKDILTGGFYYYSYSQQVKIVKAFLFLSLSDRRFAYRKLYGLWDESFVDVVKRAWNEFHDEECGWLITRFFPKEFLVKNLDALSTPYNYYYLCKRLGQEEWFFPVRDKFKSNITIAQYLEAVSMTRHPITEDEAKELLYRMVSVAIYANLANNERIETRLGEIMIDETGHDLTMSYWFRCPEFLIYKNDNFKEVLVYLCLMGLKDTVKDFCTWCDSVKAKFSDIVGPLTPSNPDVTGRKFLSVLIDIFPDKFRYMLEYETFQKQTWLNRRWRIMLQPQKRKEYGSEIRMPLVRKENIPYIKPDVINPLFYESWEVVPSRIPADEELSEEDSHEKIKAMLRNNPNLWKPFYSLGIIDSSMFPETDSDTDTDVPF